MIAELPTKDELLRACDGVVRTPHPVLHAARELAALHTACRRPVPLRYIETECARAELVRMIDRWVATDLPQARSAPYLHTESVGTVVDRIARFRVDARDALNGATTETHRHFLWQRLAELAVAYTDLASEVGSGLRALPGLNFSTWIRPAPAGPHVCTCPIRMPSGTR
ncbi:DUF4254 domain-containing protein [Nocardia veterana]|uniref:DUF4254 domain-containing protein n=1 Tax=Nocardia veterana TaxID=132249 RepID=UPI001B34E95C|nr:DUF4254 domain-containing protein [Nocardia veterana]